MEPKGTELITALPLPRLNSFTRTSPNAKMAEWMDPYQWMLLRDLGSGMEFQEALNFAFNLKWNVMLDEIRRKCGKKLFEVSHRQVALTGKSWFVCKIERVAWVKMSEQPLELELVLDPYGWGAEHNKETLEALDVFDPEKHYMIAFDLIDGDNVFMVATAACSPVVDPKLPAHPWKFKISAFKSDILEQIRRWECSVCRKTVAQQKLKKCSRCLEQRYCSKECQTHIWPIHKQSCGLLAKLHATRPTKQ